MNNNTLIPAPAMPTPLNTSILIDGVLSTVSSVTKTIAVPVGAHQFMATDRLCAYTPKGYEAIAINPFVPVSLPVMSADTAITISKISDGSNFTASTLSATQIWNYVAYGAGLFVAVSSTVGTAFASSPDGITWTARTTPTSGSYVGVVYNRIIGLFIAWTSTGYVSSPDGITWTARTAPANPTTISSANDKFFITLGTTAIYSSIDGINWVAGTTVSMTQSWKVVYGNGVYVLTGATGTVVNISYDGLIWTSAGSLTSASYYQALFINGYFVILSTTSAGYTSPDGITWTAFTSNVLFSTPNLTVTVGDGIAIGVAAGTSIYYSYDGKTWLQRNSASGTVYIGIAIGKGIVVAVNNASGTIANYSAPLAPKSPISFGVYASPITVN